MRSIKISASTAESFEVRRGQLLRVIVIEGPQAADLIAFNVDDYRESLSTWLTRQMSGSFFRAREIYSKLPAGNVMFTVISQLEHVLWLSPGRCNKLLYRSESRPNCQDLLASCIMKLGLSPFDVPDVLNIFMDARLHEDGTYEFFPSPVQSGDAFEMRAEMDVLVAISACPDDTGAYNQFRAKPLLVEIE